MGLRSFVGQLAVLHQHVAQRLIHVAGHAAGVAADIDVGTLVQPVAHGCSMLADAILDIDLVGLVAREGGVQVVLSLIHI